MISSAAPKASPSSTSAMSSSSPPSPPPCPQPRPNLFRVVYCKLRDVYNLVAAAYASLVVKHPLALIACYFLLVVSLSLGLFQATLIIDNERLTFVRDAEAEQDRARIERTFPLDQTEYYFQHKLTTFGYYVEIIVSLRPPYRSFFNSTALNQFNSMYDEIISLNITDTNKTLAVNQTREYNFTELCATRVFKCAIEGGIFRTAKFQKNLLDQQVCYEPNDPKFMYLDYELMDGGSMEYMFSQDRDQIFNATQNKLCVTDVRYVRVRFDLLFDTPEHANRSIKFMNTFVEHFQKLDREKPRKYDALDISYYTSHTMVPEIEKYSLNDVKYVLLAVAFFWFVFFLFLTYDLTTLKSFMCWKKLLKKSRRQHQSRLQETTMTTTTTTTTTTTSITSGEKLRRTSIWVRSSVYLVFVILIQLVLTAFLTCGFMSLLRVPLNTTIYSIIFALMIISCNQSLLLYKTIRKSKRIDQNHHHHHRHRHNSHHHHHHHNNQQMKFIDEEDEEIKRDLLQRAGQTVNTTTTTTTSTTANGGNPTVIIKAKFDVEKDTDDETDSDLKKKMTRASQQVLVPAFFALIATMLGYTLVGIFASFDVIRYFSFFLAVGFGFNFLGLLTFFCPCLVLYMHRVKSNRNCLLPFFKHQTPSYSMATRNTTLNSTSLTSNKNNNNIKPTGDARPHSTASTYKLLLTNYLRNKSHNNNNHSNNNTNNISSNNHKTKKSSKTRLFRIAIVLVFVLYHVFNWIIILNMGRANLPVLEALPKQSYLRRHLELHYKHFKLGPIVTLNFLEKQNYWDPDVYGRIRSLVDEIKSMKGMWPMELSWLDELYNSYTMRTDETCTNASLFERFDCFRREVEFFNQPQYSGDFHLEDRENALTASMETLNVSSSRLFLQMAKFDGTWDELVLMRTLKDLARLKYNFTRDELVLHSVVFPMLEQIGELTPSLITQLVIPLESTLLVALLFVELKSAFVLACVHISFVIGVVANLFLIGLSLNIVILMHLQLVSAIAIEFFVYMGYLYLFNTKPFRKTPSLATSSSPSSATPLPSPLLSSSSLPPKNKKTTTQNDGKIEVSDDASSVSGDGVSSSTSSSSSSSSPSSSSSDSPSTSLSSQSAADAIHDSPPTPMTSKNKSISSPLQFISLHLGIGDDGKNRKQQESEAAQMSVIREHHRHRCVEFARRNSSSVSSWFTLAIGLFAFSFLALCSTYNFVTLFALLMSICFNLFLHLNVFYPNLLLLIGPTWI